MSSSTNVGNVTVQANADAIVTGEEVSGDAGNVRVYGQVIPVQNPSFQPPVPGTQPGDPLSSLLINNLKERPVDLFRVVYKPPHGKT